MRWLLILFLLSCGTDELYLREETEVAAVAEVEEEEEVVDEDAPNPFCYADMNANCEIVIHKRERPYNPPPVDVTKQRPVPGGWGR